MYDKLCVLFGFDEVITISSDGPIFGPTSKYVAPIIINDSEKEDEAEFLGPAGPKITCQKWLFTNDIESNSCRALVSLESHVAKEDVVVVDVLEKKYMFGLKKLFISLRLKHTTSDHTTKNDESSCTSSSPSKYSFSPMRKK